MFPRMRSLVLFVTAAVSAAVGPANNSEDEQGHFARAFLQEAEQLGWQSQGSFLAGAHIELTFAVRQRNLDQLEQIFHEVSDPDSPRYGQHLTFDEVNTLTAPSQGDLAVVEDMARQLGATAVRRTANSDFVVAEVPVAAAELVFGDRFLRLRHEDGRTAVRCPGGSLPEILRAAVDFVMPLNQPLGRGGQLRTRPTLGANISSVPEIHVNTPASLRKLYSVGDKEGSSASNKQAVTAFLEEHNTDKDLQEFFRLYYKKGIGRKVARQVGDGKTGSPGVEAELDVEYVMGMGGNVETEFWSFAGRAPDNPENEPFLKFMTTLANTSDAPLVISSSYGEDEDSVSQAYAERCNVEFQKAGVRGISLLFASGDSGVGGTGGCGAQCSAGKKCFVPMWPAASPYVTAVGGTTGFGGKESAASLSSGGISYRWPRPAWQKEAVASFLAGKDLPDKSLYSHTGRGFPDVAAQAINYMVVAFAGISMAVDGTSCASPTVAGILSLVNDARLIAGKPSLGFVNPLLYKNPAALNDVTSGCNPGCGNKGFCAVPGWDAVTGLGTPNFAKLVNISLGGMGRPIPIVV